MIDIAAVWDACHAFQISEVGLVRGKINMADSFTKTPSNTALQNIMESQVDNTPIVQWILRDHIARE